MPKSRKIGMKTTSIAIFPWQEELISSYKKQIKRYPNQKGDHYESARDVLTRILEEYKKNHPTKIQPHSTMPTLNS